MKKSNTQTTGAFVVTAEQRFIAYPVYNGLPSPVRFDEAIRMYEANKLFVKNSSDVFIEEDHFVLDVFSGKKAEFFTFDDVEADAMLMLAQIFDNQGRQVYGDSETKKLYVTTRGTEEDESLVCDYVYHIGLYFYQNNSEPLLEEAEDFVIIEDDDDYEYDPLDFIPELNEEYDEDCGLI